MNENNSNCYTVEKKLQENKDGKGTVCRHYGGLQKWQVSSVKRNSMYNQRYENYEQKTRAEKLFFPTPYMQQIVTA